MVCLTPHSAQHGKLGNTTEGVGWQHKQEADLPWTDMTRIEIILRRGASCTEAEPGVVGRRHPISKKHDWRILGQNQPDPGACAEPNY